MIPGSIFRETYRRANERKERGQGRAKGEALWLAFLSLMPWAQRNGKADEVWELVAKAAAKVKETE